MVLNFNWNTDFSDKSFFTNKCNVHVLEWIKNKNAWNYQTIINGESKSGKTHLGYIWKNIAGAQFIKPGFNLDNITPVIVDDIFKFSESEIFNILCNSFRYKFHVLWLIENLEYINNLLPDIQSRFNAITHMQIPKPDNEICIHIMKKIAKDFGLEIGNDVLEFLIKRIKRSYKNIYNIMCKIHKACIQQKRAPSIIFLHSVLYDDLY